MGSHVYHYVKFFLGSVGNMPLGTPSDHNVVIVDHSNAAMPFVITAYPALWIVFSIHEDFC